VTATIVDEEGAEVSLADARVDFEIEGSGVIAAVDNGDNASSEAYQAKSRWTYKGRCIAIIRASANNGKITIKANAENLKSDSISVSIVNN
jgi:beta-galactosidase